MIWLTGKSFLDPIFQKVFWEQTFANFDQECEKNANVLSVEVASRGNTCLTARMQDPTQRTISIISDILIPSGFNGNQFGTFWLTNFKGAERNRFYVLNDHRSCYN